MGSWAYLRVGDLVLRSSNEEADPTALMLFTESDKKVEQITLAESLQSQSGEQTEVEESDENDGPSITVIYRASLQVVKDRLEFMGFTLPLVKELFSDGVSEHLASIARRRDDPIWEHSEHLREAMDREERVLQGLSFENWVSSFAYIVKMRLQPSFDCWHRPESHPDLPLVVKYLLGESPGQMWFPVFDFRVFMRAAVEVTGTDAEVIYDLTELVYDECVEADEDLCGWARRITAEEFVLNHKVVVLTEGRSDIKAIQGSLRILYPHLTDYYLFMDFEGVRAPGGAGALVSMIKAFIGAGIVNRIVALFDNDTAARSALRALRDIQLPGNVRVLHYPDAPWAEDYPTLGPQGPTNMNVNGLAGCLELYFGLDVLKQQDGSLTPVQWRGYDETLREYQGELMNKAGLQARFMEKLQRCEMDPSLLRQYDWTGMEAIINLLRSAFHEYARSCSPEYLQ